MYLNIFLSVSHVVFFKQFLTITLVIIQPWGFPMMLAAGGFSMGNALLLEAHLF